MKIKIDNNREIEVALLKRTRITMLHIIPNSELTPYLFLSIKNISNTIKDALGIEKKNWDIDLYIEGDDVFRILDFFKVKFPYVDPVKPEKLSPEYITIYLVPFNVYKVVGVSGPHSSNKLTYNAIKKDPLSRFLYPYKLTTNENYMKELKKSLILGGE